MAEIDSTHDTTGREAFEEAYIKEKLRIIGGNSPASVEKAVRAVMLRRNEDGDYDNSLEAYFSWWAWQHQAARITQLDAANKEWHDKTAWLQKDIKPKELGKHRADVLRERIDQLEAQALRGGHSVSCLYQYTLARLGIDDSPQMRVLFWDAHEALDWDKSTDWYIQPEINSDCAECDAARAAKG